MGVEEGVEVGGNDLEALDVVLLEVVSQGMGIGGSLAADEMQASSRAQGSEESGVAQVGGEGGDAGKGGGLWEVEACEHRLHVVGESAMGDAHAFGLSGGAGGVDEVGELVELGVEVGVVSGLFLQGELGIVDAEEVVMRLL